MQTLFNIQYFRETGIIKDSVHIEMYKLIDEDHTFARLLYMH